MHALVWQQNIARGQSQRAVYILCAWLCTTSRTSGLSIHIYVLDARGV